VKPSDLAKIEDELYGLPLREFTATRDARVADARNMGERELAQAAKSLRKPSVAAWLGNMLVRERGTEIDRLIGLGDKLRSIRNPSGDQIRVATKQKPESVQKLLRFARTIADRVDQPVSPAVLMELEATLDAAFSDPESAALLRSGHLTNALNYSGLGFGSERAPTSRAAKRPGDGVGGAAPTAAAKNLKALDEATRAATRAEAEAHRAERAVVSAEADLKRLRAAFAVADRKAKKARRAASAAQRKVDAQKAAAR
jgi:hypothetical protein